MKNRTSSQVKQKHRAKVKRVFKPMVRRVFAGGFPDVAWTGVQSLSRLSGKRKWGTGAGDIPLFQNGLIGFAVMRKLDKKNLAHRSVIGCKLYLVWEGSAELEVEGRRYPMKKGQWMVVPPLYKQRVLKISRASALLLFRSPDVGDTKWDKIDAEGNDFPGGKK